jgi:hypothetical protein
VESFEVLLHAPSTGMKKYCLRAAVECRVDATANMKVSPNVQCESPGASMTLGEGFESSSPSASVANAAVACEGGVVLADVSESLPTGALFDLMLAWDFDGVCETLEMIHSSGGSLSPDVLRKVRSWALLHHDVCKCMGRLDSLHDELLDLISVGGVLQSGGPVHGEVTRAEGLQACGHSDCGSLRRELLDACCEIKCATCGHDFVPGMCVETAWLRPVIFTRGWSCGTEYKTVGDFIWDPPCPEKGESVRCTACVSA